MTSHLFAEQTRLEPALVGREVECAFLRQRLEDVLLEGRGSVVLVAGGPGIGKTRLMAELEREAGEREISFLRGAVEYSRAGSAYGLFIGVLELLWERTSEPERRALRDMVEELVPHLREDLFPGAEDAPEIPAPELDPSLRHTLLSARLTRLIVEQARVQPTVLCLEDLHLADSASLQALRYLATSSRSAPLTIVGTYRPQEQRPAALERAVREMRDSLSVQELELDKLSAAQTRALVNSCFATSGFSQELMDLLYRKSEGVPLFLLQYLEHLRDEGRIYEHQEVWMDRLVASGEMPEAGQATVRQRLKLLTEEARAVLSGAAVQGEIFASELVARALGRPHAAVRNLLEHLELTTRMVRSEGLYFRFAHPLLLNACYADLSEASRRAYHLRLATYLEQQRSEDTGSLARHFYRAAAFDRAWPYLLEAARAARDNFALWEAHTHLLEALEALEKTDVPERQSRRLEMLLTLAEIAEMQGDLQRCEALCQEVLTAAPEEDGAPVGRARLELGGLHSQRGDWQEAAAHFDRALDIFTETGETRWAATTCMQLGNMAFERGDLAGAATHFEWAQKVALQGNHRTLAAGASANLGVVASVRGDHPQAVADYSQALMTYREAGHRYGMAQTYHNLGMAYAMQEEWEEALACYGRGEPLARDIGTLDVLANILVSQAATQVGQEDLDGAAASCQGAHLYYEQLENRLGLAECQKVEGAICQRRGEGDRAQRRLQQARRLFVELENPLGEAECDLELGLVRRDGGDLEDARCYLQQAVDLFARIGAVEEARKAEGLLAELR